MYPTKRLRDRKSNAPSRGQGCPCCAGMMYGAVCGTRYGLSLPCDAVLWCNPGIPTSGRCSTIMQEETMNRKGIKYIFAAALMLVALAGGTLAERSSLSRQAVGMHVTSGLEIISGND